jgi:hypothetical protein
MQPIETAWNQLIELVNQVEEAGGLGRAGSDGWTVKDHLTHIAAWEHSLLALIEGHDRERAMGLPEAVEGIDNVNEAIRKLHETDTPEEALVYFRDSHARLVAALGKLSDGDLMVICKSRTATTSRGTPTRSGPWWVGSRATRTSTTQNTSSGSIIS